ncbi:unnamed protein product [Chrysoparadoxa australica]
MALNLAVDNLPANPLAYTNKIFVSDGDFARLSAASHHSSGKAHDKKLLVQLSGDWVFTASPHKDVGEGRVALNGLQRRNAQLTLQQQVSVSPYALADVGLSALSVVVDLLSKNAKAHIQFDCERLSSAFLFQFTGFVVSPGQQLAIDYQGTKLNVTVDGIEHASSSSNSPHGLVLDATAINWNTASGSMVKLSGKKGGTMKTIIPKDFDFVKLGIGGLNNEFNQIFRRAFSSRIYPSHLIEQMGINHVRGMLLFGPPGCGKTLVARQIGKVLNSREPKIVNGPEVLDKASQPQPYVGGSEEKIRALFEEAEKEQAAEGENSMLHIIIFDEIDAICKSRGSVRDSTGVSDSIVNQLLSKIDGVDSLNNVLIIGMTNRKDMIDDALLRPGRLEVHVEIGLPDAAGRLQILSIHTLKMKSNNRIDSEALDNLGELAELTQNFSGAEIEGLVKSAASYAFHRSLDVKDLSKPIDENTLAVTWADFMMALQEVQPAFGAKTDQLSALFRNGIVHYGPSFEDIIVTLARLVEQTRQS